MTAEQTPPGAGHGTFGMIDRTRFFEELSIGPSTAFLDLGCGRGDYTLAIAEVIGPGGTIYAVDAWQDGLAEVERRAAARSISNIRTVSADVNKVIPIEDHIIDICLMATVFHDLLREGTGEVALREITRVLKPGGTLAIVGSRRSKTAPVLPWPFGYRNTRSMRPSNP